MPLEFLLVKLAELCLVKVLVADHNWRCAVVLQNWMRMGEACSSMSGGKWK